MPETNGNLSGSLHEWNLQFSPVTLYPFDGANGNASKVHSLFERNHKEHKILFNEMAFHNHTPHVLGSSYLLGAADEKLQKIFDDEAKTLVPRTNSPLRPLTTENWRDSLRNNILTEQARDFFDAEVRSQGGDWKAVLDKYLYSGSSPLFHGMAGGLIHPLIHLAYAYEFQSQEVATETLSLACIEYDQMHIVFDSPPVQTPAYKTSSMIEVFQKVQSDSRLEASVQESGYLKVASLTDKHLDVILEHYHALDLKDLNAKFRESQIVAIKLLVAAVDPRHKYDFFVAHILTGSHALRVLLHHVPAEHRVTYFRIWWLFALRTYITQMRMPLSDARIEDVELEGRDWDWVDDQAVRGPWSGEIHFVKVVRAIKCIAETWPEENEWCLKAAVRFVGEFDGWAFDLDS